MGRFDALTQVEEKPPVTAPVAKAPVANTKKIPSQSDQKSAPNIKKPEIMKTRIHENDSPLDIPVKYSTLLRTHFIKKIKIHAAETDLKDYEVIELALTAFFKSH